MQDSGQYSIITDADAKSAGACIYKRRIRKSYTDLDIVTVEEQATLEE